MYSDTDKIIALKRARNRLTDSAKTAEKLTSPVAQEAVVSMGLMAFIKDFDEILGYQVWGES